VRLRLSGPVDLVAYDEILEQLKTLRDFLASEAADAVDAGADG
jgi:hypothetical protein